MGGLSFTGMRIRRLEAKAEAAAGEAERIDKRREAIEESKRGDQWKARQVRPMSFALSVLSRKAIGYTERADRIQRRQVRS